MSTTGTLLEGAKQADRGRLESLLRGAILAQWALALVAVLLFEFEAPRLPPELQGYALSETARPASPAELVLGTFALAWLLASLVASAGVFLLKPWARVPFLVTALLGCLLMGLLEPAVTAAWSSAAETGVHLLVGFIVCLLYCTSLSADFSR